MSRCFKTFAVSVFASIPSAVESKRENGPRIWNRITCRSILCPVYGFIQKRLVIKAVSFNSPL